MKLNKLTIISSMILGLGVTLHAQDIFLDFENSTVSGGLDPENGEEVIVWEGIAPNIDLSATLVSGNYQANNPDNNGIAGEFGRINLASPVTFQLEFELIDTVTGELAPSNFNFTFYDIDSNTPGTIIESINLVSTGDGSVATFVGNALQNNGGEISTAEIGEVPNPETASGLTDEQIAQSVTYSFTNTSSFIVEYQNNGTVDGSRNFFFSGQAIVIPEPTSAVLLGIGGLALIGRRKRS